MTHQLKIACKWICALCALLCITLFFTGFCIYLLLLIPPVQQRVLLQCQEKVNDTFDGIVSIGSISTNIISYIAVKDIKIICTGDIPDSIEIGSVRAGYIAPFLLIKRIVFTNITVDDIETSITIDKMGRLPLCTQIKKRVPVQSDSAISEENRWHITAHSIALKKIKGTFNDIKHQQHAFLRNGSLKCSLHEIGKMDFILRLKGTRYRSRWWNGDVSALYTDGQLSFDGISISKILVQAEKSRLLGKGRIPFKKDGIWDISIHSTSEIDAIPVLYNAVPTLEHDGSVSIDASWRGSMKNPFLEMHLAGEGITVLQKRIDSLSVSATYNQHDSLTAQYTCNTSIGNINGLGSMVIRNLMSSRIAFERYHSTITVENLNPETAFSKENSFGPHFSGMRINASLSVDGEGVTSLPGSVSVSGISYGCSIFTDTIDVSADLNNNKWNIISHLNNNSLLAEGEIDTSNAVTGTAIVQISEPYDITRHFLPGAIKGKIHVNAIIEGTYLSPSVTANATVTDGSWKGICIDSSVVACRISASTMELDTLYARLHTEGSALESLGLRGVTGTFQSVVEATGPLFTPQVTMNITSSKGQFGSFQSDSIFLSLSLDKLDSIVIDSGKIFNKSIDYNAALYGSGSIKQKSGKVSVKVQKLGNNAAVTNVGTIVLSGAFIRDSVAVQLGVKKVPLQTFLLNDKNNKIDGYVDLHAKLNGTIKNPAVSLVLGVRDFRYTPFSADTLSARIALEDSIISLAGAITFNDTTKGVTINGKIPLLYAGKWHIDTSKSRGFSFSLNCSDVPVDQILNIKDTSVVFTGKLNTIVDAGFKNDTVALSGMLDLSNGSLKSDHYQIAVNGLNVNVLLGGSIRNPKATFRCESGKIALLGGKLKQITMFGSLEKKIIDIYSMKVILPDSGLLLFDGKIPLKEDSITDYVSSQNTIHFSVIDFPMQMVTSFLPGNYFQEGIVQGSGSIFFHNRKMPTMVAKLSLRNGVWASENIHPPIGPINATLTVTGDTIKVDKCIAKWGKGHIDIRGYTIVRNDSLPVIQCNVNAKDCSWHTPDIIHGAFDELTVACTTYNQRYEVSGDALLGNTRYIQNLQITDLINKIQSEPSIKKEIDRKGSILDSIDLNIRVDLQENAIIDINLGNLKIDGNCIISGTASKPSFIGELTIEDGTILYLDRKFAIDYATIANYNARELLPSINLEATADVFSMNGNQTENYTILLSLKGDLKNPQFSLRDQTGTLNELEIISILTLGQPLGGMSGDLKDRLASFVGQSILGFGSRKLEQFLGIEKIEVQGDLFDGNQVAENTRLTIAKRVTPRLMVLYESDIGKRNNPKFSALYRIARNIFLSGETDSDGESGIDIIFKYSR